MFPFVPFTASWDISILLWFWILIDEFMILKWYAINHEIYIRYSFLLIDDLEFLKTTTRKNLLKAS